MIRNILTIAIFGLVLFSSCTEDKLQSTIFDDGVEDLDTASPTYHFDKYLLDNFQKPYNLRFRYKMQDVGTDMSYNLVPASYENSKKIAVLTKYLWFDVYSKIVSPDFLKAVGPRIIHLIGSPAFNPANGTMILGLAEGGIKISLFRVNSINTTDVDLLNEYYFKTMHHEFAHVLHQTKGYPKDFNLISFKNYQPYSWQERDYRVAASLGFVSPYAGSQAREDFVETIANYIVKTDAQWNEILDIASKEWILKPTDKEDSINGETVILLKLEICREWLANVWGVDIDALRAEVQSRQSNIDMNKLLSEIE